MDVVLNTDDDQTSSSTSAVISTAPSTERTTEKENKHILEILRRDGTSLRRTAASQLKTVYDVDYDVCTRNSRSKTRKGTNVQHTNSKPACPDMPAMRLVSTTLVSADIGVEIPYFLRECCIYIRKHILEEGLFRKGGSCTRIKHLMVKLNETSAGNDIFSDMDNITVFEVCSAMKQLLQKMSEPLIPYDLQQVLIDCHSLPKEEGQRRSAMLISLLLFPYSNICVICYLMEFLYEVTQYVDKNKMDAKNLAIVMTPNIMPMTGSDLELKVLLAKHVDVIQELIELGCSMGFTLPSFETRLNSSLEHTNSEEPFDPDCNWKRRKRSSSLNRMFDFLRKKKLTTSSDSAAADKSLFTPKSHTPVIMVASRKRTNVHLLSTGTARRQESLTEGMHSIIPARLKLRFGRTPENDKTPSYPVQVPSLKNTSDISIHPVPLATSPRLRLPRVSSSKIPCPNTATYSMRKDPAPVSQVLSSNAVNISSSPTIIVEHHEPNLVKLRSTSASYSSLSFSNQLRQTNSLENQELRTTPLKLSPIINDILTLTNAVQCITPVSTKSTDCSEWTVTYPEPSVRPVEEILRRVPIKDWTRTAEVKRGLSFQGVRASSSPRKILKARRRSEESSGVPVEIVCTPLYSSLRSLRSRRKPISTTKSPSKCTLRRGRPNTMRAGLSRPSPNKSLNNSVADSSAGRSRKSASNILKKSGSPNTPKNIPLDRKGRISRPAYVRPGIIPCSDEQRETNPKLGQDVSELNPRVLRHLRWKSQSKAADSTQQNPLKGPLTYTFAKLRREPKFTNINNLIQQETTVVSASKRYTGRSSSMRDDLMRPSPRSCKFLTGIIPTNDRPRPEPSKVPTVAASPMKRGLSVQELVRKFDQTNENSLRPTIPVGKMNTLNSRLNRRTKNSIATIANWTVCPFTNRIQIANTDENQIGVVPNPFHQVRFNTKQTEIQFKQQTVSNNVLKRMNAA